MADITSRYRYTLPDLVQHVLQNITPGPHIRSKLCNIYQILPHLPPLIHTVPRLCGLYSSVPERLVCLHSLLEPEQTPVSAHSREGAPAIRSVQLPQRHKSPTPNASSHSTPEGPSCKRTAR